MEKEKGLNPVGVDAVVIRSVRYKCLLCGRDKFRKPYVPHKCFNGQVIKHFNHVARIRGMKSVWKCILP